MFAHRGAPTVFELVDKDGVTNWMEMPSFSVSGTLALPRNTW